MAFYAGVTVRYRLLGALFFTFISVFVLTNQASAQSLQLILDSAALDSIFNAEYGRSLPINSTFSLENLRVARITIYAVTVSFDLVFSGELEITIPFFKKQKVPMYQRVPLEASFVPRFVGHKLEIPVQEITLSFQNAVSMSISNPLVAIYEAFRRFLGSDSAVAWLQKKLTLDLDKKLSTWFKNRKFTGKVQLRRDQLHISLLPQTP